MNNSRINIIIAEDHILFAESLAVLLRQQSEYEIMDLVKDGNELLISIYRNKPDIILLDINMPGKNVIEITSEIRNKNKDIKILIVTSYATSKMIKELFKLGINGIIYKDADPKELLNAIETIVWDDKEYMQKSISDKIRMRTSYEGSSSKYNLSKRETEIIQLIKEGNSTKEIANFLFLSDYTVDTHKKNIYRKLGVNSITALIQFIIENSM